MSGLEREFINTARFSVPADLINVEFLLTKLKLCDALTITTCIRLTFFKSSI